MAKRKSLSKDVLNKLEIFDGLPESEKLYDFLSKHLSCIALFNLLFKGKDTISQITESINKKEYNNQFAFAYEFSCRCGQKITKTLAQNDYKPIEMVACSTCKTDKYIKKKESWPLKDWAVRSIFLYGVKRGIFKPYQYIQCDYCYHGKELPTGTKTVSTKCENCPNPIHLDVEFKLDANIGNYLSSSDKHGYWLEWYIAKFLKKNGIAVDKNKKYRVGGQKVEVDLSYSLNNKKIGVLCDTSKDSEFDVENFHLIPKADAYNKLVLITTNKTIAPKTISAAKKEFEEVIPLYFSDLDNLGKKFPLK